MDTDVFEDLLVKKDAVKWKNDNRTERFVLFSISGFTEQLHELEKKHDDLVLFRKAN